MRSVCLPSVKHNKAKFFTLLLFLVWATFHRQVSTPVDIQTGGYQIHRFTSQWSLRLIELEDSRCSPTEGVLECLTLTCRKQGPSCESSQFPKQLRGAGPAPILGSGLKCSIFTVLYRGRSIPKLRLVRPRKPWGLHIRKREMNL